VIHNAAKHSLRVIKYDVKTLVLKVFNEFSMSSKRVEELKECFEFVQQDFHNVLRHIPVRWLSLFNAMDRLILNWNAIKTYFIKNGKNEYDKIIWKFFGGQKNELSEQLTLSECYIWFVHHVLSIFQKHILILEKNNLNAPEVYDVMLSLRSQILNRKNDNFFRIAVTTRLPNLTSKESDIFKSDALNTYKRGLEYLKKWFDYEHSPFKLISCLKLSELPKLTDLLDLA